MWHLKEHRLSDATESFRKMLGDVALDRDVTAEPRFSALRQIKYLCLKNLASVAEEHGDKEGVLAWLGEAVVLDSNDVTVWYRSVSILPFTYCFSTEHPCPLFSAGGAGFPKNALFQPVSNGIL